MKRDDEETKNCCLLEGWRNAGLYTE